MRRTAAIAGLVALVVLAGCGGWFGTNTGTESAATVTPVAVPTDDPLSDPPPGLSEDGITDPFALADAHAEALANASFTVRWNETVVAANGTQLVNTTSVQRVGANHSRWATERTYDGTNARFLGESAERVKQWFNGTHAFYRIDRPNGTVYHVRPSFGGGTPDVTGRQQLRPYYLRAESTAVSTANGRIRVRVAVEPTNRVRPSLSPFNMTEQSVVVTMTETGRVERYRVEYDGYFVNDPATTVTGVQVARFTDIGETSIERPAWVATARNASTTPTGGG